MLSIASLYHFAGLPATKSPFLLGFGNRVTDARAYQSAGIDVASIFILDNSSQVSLWSRSNAFDQEDGRSKLEPSSSAQRNVYSNGYEDPTLKKYIDEVINVLKEEVPA